MSRATELGWQYLGSMWLADQSPKVLRQHLSDCARSPTLQGEGAARLIADELRRRGASLHPKNAARQAEVG